MNVASTILLMAAIWLSWLFGGQNEAWSWGPAFLGLGGALVCRIFARPGAAAGAAWVMWVMLLAAAGWILLGCWRSEVIDFARADAMLVLFLLGVVWTARGIDVGAGEVRILHVGLAIGVLANVTVALVQWRVPEFTWPYGARPTDRPTGFFSHYNYLSNFLLGAGFLVLARGLMGGDRVWQRVLYVVAFLGAVAVVPLSGSRGGVMALGIGVFFTLLAAAVIAWRRKSRWLPLPLIALPLVGIAGVAAGWVAIKNIQHKRNQEDRVVSVADNAARLQWMGLAIEVAAEHPVTGGGSRSFSYERNEKWDVDQYGPGFYNTRFVHNELLQTVTDYGWVGGVLVIASLLVLLGRSFVGLVAGSPDRETEKLADPIHAGVVAAAGAMLFQANFSFVFHLLPSVGMLGLLFGLGVPVGARSGEVGATVVWLRRGLGVALAVPLVWFGWTASKTLELVWPILYSDGRLVAGSPAEAVRRLESAERFWPGFRIPEEQGNLARTLADRAGPGEARDWNEMAADAYRRAIEHHPYNPELAVNLGNACSDLGLNGEAEDAFAKAIVLQGGLEAGFRARYYLARHLYALWHGRWMTERRAEEALGGFQCALALLDEADGMIGWHLGRETMPFRKSIEESIRFLEGAGVRPSPPGD